MVGDQYYDKLLALRIEHQRVWEQQTLLMLTELVEPV